MGMDDNQRIITEGLLRAGLIAAGDGPVITPLAGGVSCDVFRVDTPAGTLCAKRALPRLRVATVWEAPTQRSHYEVEWLTVARAAGDNVTVVTFPEAASTVNIYQVAVLKTARDPVLAHRFVDLVTGPAGRRVFADAGFGQA